MNELRNLHTDVLVVGAGPAGSSAATWLARANRDVLLVDAEVFPRDKACGDGLTPRAMAELGRLGMQDFIKTLPVNKGLRAHGFGQQLHLPWPGGSLPTTGSASPRTVLDAEIRKIALAAGAHTQEGAKAFEVEFNGDKLAAVLFKQGDNTLRVTANSFVIADGAKSQLGRMLGREWHKETVYGVAARAYIDSEYSDDQWISSHLELRGTEGEILSGYGWLFPLGNGQMNIGVGTLATTKRPADINLRQLIGHYTDQQRDTWKLGKEIQNPWSALLPMGGAVSGVAGNNWVLIGDAAGCVNPLNGEGIDYGLETGRLAAELISANPKSLLGWSDILREHYGYAFSIARRLAGIVVNPELLRTLGPIGMRTQFGMQIALRLMGNLVTEEDNDVVARAWKIAGKASVSVDSRKPFS
jgi:geranylgeranyl reductase family protein